MAGFGESMQAFAPAIGPGLSLAGSFIGYQGARDAGKQARSAAEFEAAQLEQNAGQSQAGAQRGAAEERRKGKLIASRALAVAAKGGGASDPGVVNILADIDAEAFYRSQLALYAGDDRARAMRVSAMARRYTGAATEQAYRKKGTLALLRGGSSLFTKYQGSTGGLSDDDWGMEY